MNGRLPDGTGLPMNEADKSSSPSVGIPDARSALETIPGFEGFLDGLAAFMQQSDPVGFQAMCDAVEAAQGIEAGTDETAQQAQPEGQEPGPKDAPNTSQGGIDEH